MKVTNLKCFEVDANYFIVKVETDEGIYGLGESGIRFWSRSIEQAVVHLSELVVGQDPFATERLFRGPGSCTR